MEYNCFYDISFGFNLIFGILGIFSDISELYFSFFSQGVKCRNLIAVARRRGKPTTVTTVAGLEDRNANIMNNWNDS